MIRLIARLLPRNIRAGACHQLRASFPQHFRTEHSAETFSQCGEDRILAFLFGELKIKCPRYLDVGTCHPCEANNTYLFYRTGATGVCIEPNPDMIPLICEMRPRDKILNVGLSPHGSGKCRYFLFGEPSFNTFDAEEAAARSRSGRHPIVRELTVEVVSLESIIANHFPDGLEFLSLDAEGLDVALLQSLNFNKHRPLAICVETVGFSETLAKPRNNVIDSLMATHGYARFANTFVNTIFVDLQRTGPISL